MKNEEYNKQMLVVLDDMAQSQRKIQFWITFWSVISLLIFICTILFTIVMVVFGILANN